MEGGLASKFSNIEQQSNLRGSHWKKHTHSKQINYYSSKYCSGSASRNTISCTHMHTEVRTPLSNGQRNACLNGGYVTYVQILSVSSPRYICAQPCCRGAGTLGVCGVCPIRTK
ncbi:hypothetical protein AMECASPLE_031972 [Ameca splendens]|uniref:Uncharacterized protein n=1 Tax=Ameca splendens TaxID=208324 RepID=A0ABV1AFG4_9TELE